MGVTARIYDAAHVGEHKVRGVKSAARTVALLELLADRGDRPSRLDELSEELTVPRSSTYLLCTKSRASRSRGCRHSQACRASLTAETSKITAGCMGDIRSEVCVRLRPDVRRDGSDGAAVVVKVGRWVGTWWRR